MTELIVVSATALVVIACVLLHYQAFKTLTGVMARHMLRRRGLIIVMLGLLVVHGIEIAVFAQLYALLDSAELGGAFIALPSTQELDFSEYFYFSSVVYTTLGFGDLVPHGMLRLVTGIEALTGFSLITWSASFTFLEMQQFWVADDS